MWILLRLIVPIYTVYPVDVPTFGGAREKHTFNLSNLRPWVKVFGKDFCSQRHRRERMCPASLNDKYYVMSYKLSFQYCQDKRRWWEGLTKWSDTIFEKGGETTVGNIDTWMCSLLIQTSSMKSSDEIKKAMILRQNKSIIQFIPEDEVEH